MTSIGRLLAVIAAVLLVIGAAVFLFFRSSISSEGLYRVSKAVGLETAAPERHIVPENFQGWVAVHYGVASAPPLGEDEGAVILEYPDSGRIETSSPAPDDQGLLQRGYYRRAAGGLVPLSRVGEIWGEYSHVVVSDDAVPVVSRFSGFFVGTMTEFLATKWPAEHAHPEGARR